MTEMDCSEGECGQMDVRQSESTPCKLEKIAFCDGEWQEFADLRLCIPKMRMLNGVLQQDTTGNGDWENAGDPEHPMDERTDGTVTPAWAEPPEGEDGACLAAANAIAYVRQRVQQICYANRDYYEFLVWFSVLVAGLALLTGVGLIIVVLSGALIAIVSTFSGGPEDWGDAGDFDFTSDLLCAFKSAFATDGTMSESAWVALRDDIAAIATEHAVEAEHVAINLAELIVWAVGPVGMSRAANFAGIATYDCSSCVEENVTTYDFTGGQQLGWSLYDADNMSRWADTGWADDYPNKAYDGIGIKSPESGEPWQGHLITKLILYFDQMSDGWANYPRWRWLQWPDANPAYDVNGGVRQVVEIVGTYSPAGQIAVNVDAYVGGFQSYLGILQKIEVYWEG
jgi:hypothetical protein